MFSFISQNSSIIINDVQFPIPIFYKNVNWQSSCKTKRRDEGIKSQDGSGFWMATKKRVAHQRSYDKKQKYLIRDCSSRQKISNKNLPVADFDKQIQILRLSETWFQGFMKISTW